MHSIKEETCCFLEETTHAKYEGEKKVAYNRVFFTIDYSFRSSEKTDYQSKLLGN